MQTYKGLGIDANENRSRPSKSMVWWYGTIFEYCSSFDNSIKPKGDEIFIIYNMTMNLFPRDETATRDVGRTTRRKRRVAPNRQRDHRRRDWILQQPLSRLGVSSEVLALALVLWCMIALALHVLLVDATTTTSTTTSSSLLSQESEVGALRAISRRYKRSLAAGGTAGQERNHERQGQRHRHNHNHGYSPNNKSPRQEYEERYPPTDTTRIRDFVMSLRDDKLDANIGRTTRTLPYNVLDCPSQPPPDYPLHYSLLQVLQEWPADELQWPPFWQDESNNEPDHPYLYHSLCIFDWNRDEHRQRMQTYAMEYDVPIIVRNQPEFVAAAERWMRDDPTYLQALIGNEEQRTEHSTNNHLPFWRIGKKLKKHQQQGPPGWKPPTENIQMSFADWHQAAADMQQAVDEGQDHTTRDHYYFRLNGTPDHNAYLYQELPLFDPNLVNQGENIFMWEPDQSRGINCRLGMAGNIAETHYDASRNWIALIGGGQRRYILSHPRSCPDLALHPLGHPSARHSAVDWSEIGKTNKNGPTHAAQRLERAKVTQVVLQASDALFLPMNWFHFIVSLNRNYQCNARSGQTETYNKFIRECGFTIS